jgi:hypothetical protein
LTSGASSSPLQKTYFVPGNFCGRIPWIALAFGISRIASVFITSQRTRATRVFALSFMNRYLPSYLPSVNDMWTWCRSPLSWIFLPLAASCFLVFSVIVRWWMRIDSLVSPQPVAEQRLNTGTRISSRIDGMPRMRISPVWPEDQKP